MNPIKPLKVVIWLMLTTNLLVVFFLGIIISSQSLEPWIIEYLIIPLIIASDFIILSYFKIDVSTSIFRKKLLIWLMISINLLFAFMIGLTIPLLVSESRDNLGYIMIPLLVILNYVILDRFHYYQKHSSDERDKNE